MLFTDWHFDENTLMKLGSVIKTINSACDDPMMRRRVFVRYFEEDHPHILPWPTSKCERPPDVAKVLESLNLPKISFSRPRPRRTSSWNEVFSQYSKPGP